MTRLLSLVALAVVGVCPAVSASPRVHHVRLVVPWRGPVPVLPDARPQPVRVDSQPVTFPDFLANCPKVCGPCQMKQANPSAVNLTCECAKTFGQKK